RALRFFFFSSRRRHTSSRRGWSADGCSADLIFGGAAAGGGVRGAAGGAEAAESARGDLGAELVVLLALGRVTDDVVGLADPLELVLGGSVAQVRIRVVLTREFAIRLSDIVLRRVLGDAELGVIVLLDPFALAHQTPPFMIVLPVRGRGRSTATTAHRGSADDDHRRPQGPLAVAVPLAQDRSEDRVGSLGFILHRFVHRWVERVAFLTERLASLRGEQGPDLVGEHLERPLLEIAVLAGTLEVVGDRQQL